MMKSLKSGSPYLDMPYHMMVHRQTRSTEYEHKGWYDGKKEEYYNERIENDSYY